MQLTFPDAFFNCLLFFRRFQCWRLVRSQSACDVHPGRLTPDLMELQLCSKSTSTVSKYVSGCRNKWRPWAMSKARVPVVPVGGIEGRLGPDPDFLYLPSRVFLLGFFWPPFYFVVCRVK